MRKYILNLMLIIFILLFFLIMFFGFKIGNYKISSYREIQVANTKRNNLISELNYKNDIEFNTKKSALKTAVQEYNNKKSQYDKLVANGQIQNNDLNGSMELYDYDFLLTNIGGYATRNGVVLQLDTVKNSDENSKSSEYVMCDLNITVTGEYTAITNFIFSLEDDEKLNFEINDFLMEKGGENLQATFTVQRIPINSKNLSETSYTTNVDTSNQNSGN